MAARGLNKQTHVQIITQKRKKRKKRKNHRSGVLFLLVIPASL